MVKYKANIRFDQPCAKMKIAKRSLRWTSYLEFFDRLLLDLDRAATRSGSFFCFARVFFGMMREYGFKRSLIFVQASATLKHCNYFEKAKLVHQLFRIRRWFFAWASREDAFCIQSFEPERGTERRSQKIASFSQRFFNLLPNIRTTVSI